MQARNLALRTQTFSPCLLTLGRWTAKCGPGWEDDVATEYCYQFNTDFKTWNEARGECRANGGELVSIVNREQQTFIQGKTLNTRTDINTRKGYQQGVTDFYKGKKTVNIEQQKFVQGKTVYRTTDIYTG